MNRLITLVSGGIDSTLMSVLAHEQNFELFPLFIDYGQLAAKLEWDACRKNHHKHGLPRPRKLSVRGFGKLIHSGLTDKKLRIREDAFLPGRNTLFLVAASSYAYQIGSRNIAIGLLSDKFKFFPDQTNSFIKNAEEFVSEELDYGIKILTPLMKFNKAEVMELAKSKKIDKTYSCHAGTVPPCGKCISCREIKNAKRIIGGK